MVIVFDFAGAAQQTFVAPRDMVLRFMQVASGVGMVSSNPSRTLAMFATTTSQYSDVLAYGGATAVRPLISEKLLRGQKYFVTSSIASPIMLYFD